MPNVSKSRPQEFAQDSEDDEQKQPGLVLGKVPFKYHVIFGRGWGCPRKRHVSEEEEGGVTRAQRGWGSRAPKARDTPWEAGVSMAATLCKF